MKEKKLDAGDNVSKVLDCRRGFNFGDSKNFNIVKNYGQIWSMQFQKL